MLEGSKLSGAYWDGEDCVLAVGEYGVDGQTLRDGVPGVAEAFVERVLLVERSEPFGQAVEVVARLAVVGAVLAASVGEVQKAGEEEAGDLLGCGRE